MSIPLAPLSTDGDAQQPAPKEQAARGAPKTSDATRDLNDAIESVFATEVGGTSFAVKLCELVLALTNAPSVGLWAPQDVDGEVTFEELSTQGSSQDGQILQDILAAPHEKLEGDRAAAVMAGGYFIANIARPDGGIAKLVLVPPHGGGAALGLAYERISLVSQLSFSHFRNGEVMAQTAIRRAIAGIAAGTPDAAQTLADALASTTNADHAAVGEWQAGRLTGFAISGQAGGLNVRSFRPNCAAS
jgi:hypothetical protein